MDFAGYLNLQKDHLLDLGSSSELSNDVSSAYVGEIQQKLNEVKNAYDEANVTTRDIVTNQEDVVDMVNDETTRLEQKKDSIDTALEGQKRMITLNDSYRMRYRYYLYMVVTVLVVTVLYVVIRFLSKYLPGVPGAVWDLLLIIIFAVAVWILYTSWLDIKRRDIMNFNKLSFNPPKKEDAVAKTQVTQVTEDGEVEQQGDQEMCKGQDCCPPDHIYDEQTNACIETETFKNNNLVKPNEPSEFVNYSKY